MPQHSKHADAHDEDCVLTEREAAEDYLRIAPITLTQWRHAGKAPPHIKLGRAIRYRRTDVLAWRDARIVGKVAP